MESCYEPLRQAFEVIWSFLAPLWPIICVPAFFYGFIKLFTVYLRRFLISLDISLTQSLTAKNVFATS